MILFRDLIGKCNVEVRGEVEGWVSSQSWLLLEPLTCGEDGLNQLAPQGPVQCLDLGCVVSGWAQPRQAVGRRVWTHNDFLRVGERI